MQYALPGDVLDRAPALFIRYFLGRERAAMIGIDEAPLPEAITNVLRLAGVLAGNILNDSPALSRFAEKFGNLLINSIVLVGRGNNRPSFRIPDELRQAWGVNWTS
jgi:hypothetical protein